MGAIGFDGVRFFDSWIWNPRYIYPGGHAMTGAAVMAKTPKYLKPENVKPDTPPPLALGDRVEVRDYSASLILGVDGLKEGMLSGGMSGGRIVAIDCVLPATPSVIDGSPRTNDTIVACDDGKFVFTQTRFLRRLT